MVKVADLGWELLLLGALLAAAVPWTLEGRPSETLIWAFAMVPPLLLAALLGFRERRERVRLG